jgi:magnesium transporter
MLRKYAVVDGKLTETENGSSILWLFTDPDTNERKTLVSDFHIDEHTLSSALDPDESARVEFENDHISLLFKYPKNYSAADQFLFRVASIGLFLFPDRLVVVLPEDVPVVGGRGFAGVNTPRAIMLKLLYRLIYRYLEHLKVINMVSDEIERKISISMENRYLLNLFSLEKSMVYYLNAIGSNGFALEKIRHACGGRLDFTAEEVALLDDIVIDNNQCYRQAEIYSNILASLMDARVSIVSNNLNILMKNLNLITIGIMVPTFVVSAFSMNVNIPMDNVAHAFWIILGLAAASVAGVIYWWKRSKL